MNLLKVLSKDNLVSWYLQPSALSKNGRGYAIVFILCFFALPTFLLSMNGFFTETFVYQNINQYEIVVMFVFSVLFGLSGAKVLTANVQKTEVDTRDKWMPAFYLILAGWFFSSSIDSIYNREIRSLQNENTETKMKVLEYKQVLQSQEIRELRKEIMDLHLQVRRQK